MNESPNEMSMKLCLEEIIWYTGIPLEHEIPAPVTTTMRFLFTTPRERETRARRVVESVGSAFSSKVVYMIARDWGKQAGVQGGRERVSHTYHVTSPSQRMLY